MASRSLPDNLELLLKLHRGARRSLQHQLLEQLGHILLQGHVAAGQRLPSTRTLARALGISRNIVEAVYDELVVEGYMVRRHGSGTYVAHDLAALPRKPFQTAPAPPQETLPTPQPAHDDSAPMQAVLPMGPGMPDTAAMPSSVWRAIWRDVASQSLPSYFGSPSGDLEFRTALAQYLGRARHVFCTAEDIVVTSGALQALNLLAQAMLKPGDPVGFEEPGYLMARQALLGQGLRILPIPVDEDGLKVDALPRGPEAPPLVYVTPSHQYPLGGRLSIARRMALLGWASENGRIIVEDDYDSEFRFDAPPLPALAGLDHAGRVVYIGTFSKIFMPSLRVGYLVTSNVELRQHIEHIRWLTDLHAAWPSQRALLSFIAGGHMDRHVLRMRRLYARKRALLNEILAPLAPIARLRGMEAGLHAYLELSEGLDSSDIAARLYERGVIVVPIDNFYFGKPDRTGLVLGYGALSMQDLARGVSILKEVIELRAAEFVKRK